MIPAQHADLVASRTVRACSRLHWRAAAFFTTPGHYCDGHNCSKVYLSGAGIMRTGEGPIS